MEQYIMEIKSTPQKFSLWHKTFKARLLRFLLFSVFLSTSTLIKMIFWVDCPIEVHIPLNNTNKIYEAEFNIESDVHNCPTYSLELIDPSSTNFKESKLLLSEIKIQTNIFFNDKKRDGFITDPIFFKAFPQDFKKLNGMTIRHISETEFFLNRNFRVTLQLLEIPKLFPNKKEVIFRIQSVRSDKQNPNWEYLVILYFIVHALLLITVVFGISCYKPGTILGKIKK